MNNPVTITIDGRDRHWVAEALIEQAIHLEAQVREKRGRSTIKTVMDEAAGRLRSLSNMVRG